MDTPLVADQFDISRRRVQQLAKTYRDTDGIPTFETPGRAPYAGYPPDLEDRITENHRSTGSGAVAASSVLRVRNGLSIDTNRFHAIMEEYNHVTENPNKQGPSGRGSASNASMPVSRFTWTGIRTTTDSRCSASSYSTATVRSPPHRSGFSKSSPTTVPYS